jgi:ketosteroid isomerase-like protein
MKKTIVFTAFTFCIIMGSFGQTKDVNKDKKKEDKKEEKSLIEKQIQVNDKKLINFSIKARVDSLIDLYSPSCYYTKEYDKRIDGRDDLQKKFIDDFKTGLKISEMSLSSDDIKINGDMAIEIGVLTIKYTTSAKPAIISEKNNYMIIWKKSSDGKYRIRYQIASPINYPCK